MAHVARHMRLGIGVPKPARSICSPPSTAHRIAADTRTFFSRLASHLFPPARPRSQPALVRPTQFSSSQSIHARFSLPVKHALSRPFSPPRLPRPPVVPANVTQGSVGSQWDVKMKKKEARRMRRPAQNKTVPRSQERLKPKPQLECGASELDVYFPVEPTPAVTTHLLVPLAPTPTARLPLSARTDGGDAHPLLPIPDLASVHTSHRLHSFRVSTLFARLDTANVWDDPGVNVDAYAFGPRHGTQEKQCTVLRVTFRGWNAGRVRSILGHSAEEWYSLEETHPDGHPTLVPLPDPRQDVYVNTCSDSPSLESVEIDSSRASEAEMGDGDVCDVLSSLPIRAIASAQHDLVLPTLDFSSAFSDAVDNPPPPPQPVMFLRTVSELMDDAELVSHSASVLMDSEGSWECLGLNPSAVEHRGDKVTEDM